MGLFSKSKSENKDGANSILDQTLLCLPGVKTNITWADSIEGTLILGSTGSGKSSGPGAYMAKAMLEAGFGFCVLCAKPSEKELWLSYLKHTGRLNDIILFNPDSGLKFNFLKYELEREGRGAGEIVNLINTLMGLNEQSKIHQLGGESKEERFWDNALRRLISRAISFLSISGEDVSITNLRELTSSCFRQDDVVLYKKLTSIIANEQGDEEEKKTANTHLNAWAKENYFLRVMENLKSRKTTGAEKYEAEKVENYWLKEFPKISDKTQSIVLESFMGIIEPFVSRGVLQEFFSSGHSPELNPENIIKNKKVVIIDYPIKEYGISAIFAASIYKSTFQAAMERRNIATENDPKPVVLWIDEYQNFCSPASDSLFQVTARSSWVSTVYITQNINNIYFVMGSSMAKERAKSLLGNLNLKFFAANSDYDTNMWASEMIGKDWVPVDTVSISKENDISKTINSQLNHMVPPYRFTQFKTGRKLNNFTVEAIVFKAGKTWGNEEDNYALVEFKQA